MSISFSALSGVKYILYIPVCGDGWVCYYGNNNLRFTENLKGRRNAISNFMQFYYIIIIITIIIIILQRMNDCLMTY